MPGRDFREKKVFRQSVNGCSSRDLMGKMIRGKDLVQVKDLAYIVKVVV